MQILTVINFTESTKFLSLIVLKKNGIVLAMNSQTQLETQKRIGLNHSRRIRFEQENWVAESDFYIKI